MPNGIYPHPLVPGQSPPAHSDLGLRLRVWWDRGRLDELLARGADPASSAALRLRAAQLGNIGERFALARRLQAVVRDAAQGRPSAFSVQVSPRRDVVVACSADLIALAQRLADDLPIDVQGVAMVSRLLTDGASPLYYGSASRPLRYTVRSARLALDPLGQPVQVPVEAA